MALPAGLHCHRVGETPEPPFAGLQRADDLVIGRVLVRVPRSMPILGGIATADLSAGHAHAQMNPGVTKRKTLLTALGTAADIAYLVQMRACRCSAAAATLQRSPRARHQSHSSSLTRLTPASVTGAGVHWCWRSQSCARSSARTLASMSNSFSPGATLTAYVSVTLIQPLEIVATVCSPRWMVNS
jgi:hypothetical protein